MQISNWDDIRFFLAVYKEGSLSAAAKALAVNHTTVARRIASLEDNLKVKLFDRHRDGYALTPHAESVLNIAEEMDSRAQAFTRKIMGQDIQLKGKLCITIPDSFSFYFLSKHIKQFNAKFPEIDLQVISSDKLLNLNALEADLAIRFTDNPPENLIGRRVATLDYAVYAAKNLLENKLTLKQEKVKALTWLNVDGDPLWLKKNFPNIQVGSRFDSVMSMIGVLRQGSSIAQIPCFMGEIDPLLSRVPTKFVEPGWGLWILHHVDLKKSSKVRAAYQFFSEILISELASYSLKELSSSDVLS